MVEMISTFPKYTLHIMISVKPSFHKSYRENYWEIFSHIDDKDCFIEKAKEPNCVLAVMEGGEK